MTNSLSGKIEWRTEISNSFYIATAIILLSSLPFIHEFFIDENGELYTWVPNLGIQEFLTFDGKILGYSYYDLFLFVLFMQLYSLIGFVWWKRNSANKDYTLAIYLPIAIILYHLLLLFTNSRKTDWNNIEVKLAGSLVLFIFLLVLYVTRKKKEIESMQHSYKILGVNPPRVITVRLLGSWGGIFLVSMIPYLYDIVTLPGEGVKDWIPVLGIEKLLTVSEGNVWGFNSYRAFIYTLMVQVFAQIGWVGLLMDSKYKLYMPFVWVPVGLTLYQILLIIVQRSETHFNHPDNKFYLTLAIAFSAAVFFLYKNKNLIQRRVPQ